MLVFDSVLFFESINRFLTIILFLPLSAVVQGDTIEDVYAKCKNVIWTQTGPSIWVPSKESL